MAFKRAYWLLALQRELFTIFNRGRINWLEVQSSESIDSMHSGESQMTLCMCSKSWLTSCPVHHISQNTLTVKLAPSVNRTLTDTTSVFKPLPKQLTHVPYITSYAYEKTSPLQRTPPPNGVACLGCWRDLSSSANSIISTPRLYAETRVWHMRRMSEQGGGGGEGGVWRWRTLRECSPTALGYNYW